MNQRASILLLMIAFLLGLWSPAEAKWWIFGQSNEEVSFSYLYLNGISYEESGPKTSVPKSSLQDGQLQIRGKAKVGKGNVGGVRVSIDDRATWQNAKVADDGTFEFLFRPELARTYVLFVEVIDTVGKSNDVDKTRKEVTIIESNIQQLVKVALEELMAAYRGEDPARFMKLVSENFAGDSANLDRAIRKDFSAFDNFDIRYTFNNVSIDPAGRAFAAITFSRSVTSSKSGKTLSDKGSTEFVFKMEEGVAKVFSMKNPLIFGLSDPGEVATGSTAVSDPLIIVDGGGNVAKVPPSVYLLLVKEGSFTIVTNPDGTSTVTSGAGSYTISSDGTLISSGGGSETVESGTLTLTSSAPPPHFDGIDFATGIVSETVNDIYLGYLGFLGMKDGVTFRDLGLGTINSVTSVPDPATSSYSNFTSVIDLTGGVNDGHLYAIRIANGNYAVIEIVTSSVNNPGNTTATIKYKYQPAGGRNF